MIIFNDIEFARQLAAGTVPKNIYQNITFRALARARNTLDLDPNDIEDIICENTNFQPEMMDWYFGEFTEREPAVPHPVTFSRADILRINKLKAKRNKKIYLAILFLTKYFNTKRLRLSLQEIKTVIGLKNQNGLNYKTVTMGEGVTYRREKNGIKMDPVVIRNHKGYFYYYPPENEGFADEIAFQFDYIGSPYYLPSVDYHSNLCELWNLYLQASEKDKIKAGVGANHLSGPDLE